MRGDAFTPVPNRVMITISIMLANIMQGLDNTILNVALPHIQGSLSASLDQVAWALTSYIVCSAIMMPLTGWLAGRFGIKHIFLASIVGFTIALGAVRRRHQPRRTGGISRATRGRWSWPHPAVASHPVADQPTGAARARDGGVRRRHDLRADHGAGTRRLADPGTQLALGVLHQPADRSAVYAWRPRLHPSQPQHPSRAVRRRRIPRVEPGDRRLAAAARPRRAEGLVQSAASKSWRTPP